VAMTALTFAVFVVPADLDPPGDARVQARVPALEPAAIEVAITAIEVVGVRAQKTALERALALVPKPRQRG
jgi:hypothetical protein